MAISVALAGSFVAALFPLREARKASELGDASRNPNLAFFAGNGRAETRSVWF